MFKMFKTLFGFCMIFGALALMSQPSKADVDYCTVHAFDPTGCINDPNYNCRYIPAGCNPVDPKALTAGFCKLEKTEKNCQINPAGCYWTFTPNCVAAD